MADYDLPDDLIDLRRAFLAAQERLAELGRAMPSHTMVAAGEAEPATEGQRQAWWDAQKECQRLAVEIHRHSWWETVDSRQKAERALRDAAATQGDDLDQVG